MARPLEFDKLNALDAATGVIWAQGYRGTSLNDLVDAMGLNKSSIYNSFGNKQDVLLEALDHYAAAQLRMLKSLFAQSGFRDGLDTLFCSILEDNNGGRGCLLVNCAAELARQDARIAQRVQRSFDAIAEVFAASAMSAQASGELAAQIDPVSLSKSLLAFVSGLRILAKCGMDREALLPVVHSTLERLVPKPL